MLASIYPIVEGHGEVHAVPILLRRFAHQVFQNNTIVVFPAHRIPRSQMIASGSSSLHRAVELGARKITNHGGIGAILVICDADDDCPAELGPILLNRIQGFRGDIPSRVVLAKKEFESWFLASAISLRSKCHIKPTAVPPAAPEEIRDAKGYLESQLMEQGSYYSPTADQPTIAGTFSFDEADACTSFQKLRRDLNALFSL